MDEDLVAGVVGVAGENGQGPVYLLGQNHAGELMRQGHPPEGKKQIGTLTCGRRPPIRRSDGEHQALDALIANATEVRGELLRGELLAATIQQNGIRRSATRLTIQPIEQGGLGPEKLGVAGNVMGGPLYIVGQQSIGRLSFGTRTSGSDDGESDLHYSKKGRIVLRPGSEDSCQVLEHRKIHSPESDAVGSIVLKPDYKGPIHFFIFTRA